MTHSSSPKNFVFDHAVNIGDELIITVWAAGLDQFQETPAFCYVIERQEADGTRKRLGWSAARGIGYDGHHQGALVKAIVEAVYQVPHAVAVRFETTNEAFLVRSINEHRHSWRAQGWKKSDGKRPDCVAEWMVLHARETEFDITIRKAVRIESSSALTFAQGEVERVRNEMRSERERFAIDKEY